MPVPEGQITGSQIWTGEPDTEEKQYEVVATYKVRKRIIVSAPSEEAADAIASGYFSVENSGKYDEFMSEYAIKVKEVE